MAGQDMTEKTLESYNDVFADIVNVLLFKGKRLVGEDELVPESLRSIYKADGKLHEQERDVAKRWQNGNVRIAILGFENQTKVDVDMPLRVISYDGAAYRSQLLKDKEADASNDRYAVVTMVLYFGYKHHWNQAENLLGRLHVPEELKPYVSDYKINVFEIAWLTDEEVNMFQSDFRMVADYFVQMRKNKGYVPPKDTIRHVHEFLQLMTVMTGDHRYEETYETAGRRPSNMCEVMEAAEKKGIEQGIEQGRIRATIKTLSRYARRNLPIDSQVLADIAEDNDLTVERVREIAKENNVVLPC